MQEHVEASRLKDASIEEGKFFAVISYISFLSVVSLLIKKNNSFVAHHARQGLVLFVGEVLVWICAWLPGIGALLQMLGWVVFFIASVWGAYQAFKGRESQMPLVYLIAQKVNL